MTTPSLASVQSARKVQLLRQREQLLERMAHERGGVLGRAQVAAEQMPADVSDNAQQRSERETHFAWSEHETAELAAIERALERIAQAEDASCLDCGCTIATARLLATPTALRCLACQSAFEKQHPSH